MRWSSFFTAPFKPGPILSHNDQNDDPVDRSAPVTVASSYPYDQLREVPQSRVPSPSFPSPGHANLQEFVITHIRANDIAVNLGRVPVGFYTAVVVGHTQWRTSNKPILVHDRNIEWDDEMLLPLALSSDIHIRVCASFEFSPTLGGGETLRTFVLGIDQLLEHSGMAQFEFCPPEGEPQSPCSWLRITVERRIRTLDPPRPVSSWQNHISDLDESSDLAQITDEGHESLLCYHKHQKPEDLKHAVACFDRALKACPPANQYRAVVLFNLATARLISCQMGVTSPDFDVPITLYRDALDLRPVGHPDRPATLFHLACATISRFSKWGDESYAEEAKNLLAQVHDVCCVDSYEYQSADLILQEFTIYQVSDRSMTLSHPTPSPTLTLEPENAVFHSPDHQPAKFHALSVALLKRYEQLGHEDDLNKSITAMEKALELTQESHPEWFQRAIGLGALVSMRFGRHKCAEGLERSISVLDKVVQRMPDGSPGRPIALFNLGILLLARFSQFGRTEDINRSTSMHDQALELIPNDHSNRSMLLTYAGEAFLKRFQHLPDPVYLDKAIHSIEAAAQCLPRDDDGASSSATHSRTNSWVAEYWRVANLINAFGERFNLSGDPTDLGKLITMTEQVLKFTPNGHRDRPSWLTHLGHTFFTRYHHSWNLADLHNSTSLFTEAVRLMPSGHPDWLKTHDLLGLSLLTRFNRLGKIVDIDKAISAVEEAVQCSLNHHPMKPRGLLILGFSFLTRFRYLGNLADLEKSAPIMEEAVRLMPEDHLARSRGLTLLARSYIASFDRLGHISDLDKAILTLEDAEKYVPTPSATLFSLAHALHERSNRLGNMVDLDKSILVGQRAIQIAEEGDPELPLMINLVGVSRLRRFIHLGDVTDLDEASCLIERALHLIPEDSPERPALLTNSGTLSMLRFQHFGSLPALRCAISYFSYAAHSPPSGKPLTQFQALKHWIQCATLLQRESSPEGDQAMFEGFECAVRLFPQLAWIGLPLKDRYAQLLEASAITRSAAAVAVNLGHAAKAVEWLEQGRCVVWGQLFQLRSPLDELRPTHPDLANQIEWLSCALEHSSATFDESLLPLDEKEGKDRSESLEQRAQRHRELVTERENLVRQVQALPGFERLFLPKTFSQLRASAHLGPIVVLNAYPKQCDALIVVADLEEPVHLPLPDINDGQVESLRTMLNRLLSNDGRVISRDEMATRAARPITQNGWTFSHILSELWTKVVEPVLRALALSTPGKLTRVFWCPTGPFSFLPLHAAGNYDISGPGNKASDFIISSYIPTLSVLAPSRERIVVSNNVRLLAVPQPSSDGQTQLFGVRDEIAHIKATTGRLSSTRVHLHESNGNVEQVLNEMEQSDWVHFACHGVQDPESPTHSGLCLADRRRLRLSDIIRVTRPRGGLAFLSACQTATGAEELQDEAVHVAAGMLFAGYSSVIGTMWSIRDSVAPRLAQDVYEQLFHDDGAPDSREAARALHFAAERLRQSGEPFIAWVPFIHMGV